MPPRRTPASSEKTKTTGVYDKNFEEHITDWGIYLPSYRRPASHPLGQKLPKPRNYAELRRIVGRPRGSLDPEDDTVAGEDGTWERFVCEDAVASSEWKVCEMALPFIEGRIADSKCRSGGHVMGNLAPLTNDSLKPGNPDIYYGARPEQLNLAVRNVLSECIVFCTDTSRLLALNFFVVVKGKDGSNAVAERHVVYDGALGARGIQKLKWFGDGEETYDGNAYTISAYYHQRGSLTIYAIHVEGPPKEEPELKPEYIATMLGGWRLDHSEEAWCEGVAAYRNARKWCEEQRDAFIAAANARVQRETKESVIKGLKVSVADSSEEEEDAFVDAEETVHVDVEADITETTVSNTKTVPEASARKKRQAPISQPKAGEAPISKSTSSPSPGRRRSKRKKKGALCSE